MIINDVYQREVGEKKDSIMKLKIQFEPLKSDLDLVHHLIISEQYERLKYVLNLWPQWIRKVREGNHPLYFAAKMVNPKAFTILEKFVNWETDYWLLVLTDGKFVGSAFSSMLILSEFNDITIRLIKSIKFLQTFRDNSGMNAMHLACFSKNMELAYSLLENYPHMAKEIDSVQFNSPFHFIEETSNELLAAIRKHKLGNVVNVKSGVSLNSHFGIKKTESNYDCNSCDALRKFIFDGNINDARKQIKVLGDADECELNDLLVTAIEKKYNRDIEIMVKLGAKLGRRQFWALTGNHSYDPLKVCAIKKRLSLMSSFQYHPDFYEWVNSFEYNGNIFYFLYMNNKKIFYEFLNLGLKNDRIRTFNSIFKNDYSSNVFRLLLADDGNEKALKTIFSFMTVDFHMNDGNLPLYYLLRSKYKKLILSQSWNKKALMTVTCPLNFEQEFRNLLSKHFDEKKFEDDRNLDKLVAMFNNGKSSKEKSKKSHNRKAWIKEEKIENIEEVTIRTEDLNAVKNLTEIEDCNTFQNFETDLNDVEDIETLEFQEFSGTEILTETEDLDEKSNLKSLYWSKKYSQKKYLRKLVDEIRSQLLFGQFQPLMEPFVIAQNFDIVSDCFPDSKSLEHKLITGFVSVTNSEFYRSLAQIFLKMDQMDRLRYFIIAISRFLDYKPNRKIFMQELEHTTAVNGRRIVAMTSLMNF